MEKIPAAEELFDSTYNMSGGLNWTKDARRVGIWVARRLSRLHVEAALKAASESAKISNTTIQTFDDPKAIRSFGYMVDKESILSAYPPENIK